MSDPRVATPTARWIGVFLAVACSVTSIARYGGGRATLGVWWWQAAALALAMASLARLPLAGTDAAAPRPLPASTRRRVVGVLTATAGAALWVYAIRALRTDWAGNFDAGWAGVLLAATLLSLGLDLCWAQWPRCSLRVSRPALAALVALIALAALYRLGTLAEFPGPAGITQIEELQTGNWGAAFLAGNRGRWEYLSWMLLAALGIHVGGPTLTAMRVPFAAVSVLKLVPLFLWLRWAAGTGAALVASALLACSTYDVILSHVPNNHDALVVAAAFALLAGPARRGRPSAYVWLGLCGGYVLYGYVAYRPLAVFVIAGAAWLSLRDPHVGWPRRVLRPLCTVALVVSMGVPLFFGLLPARQFRQEYLNGWERARVIAPYYAPGDTWAQALAKRLERTEQVAGLFFFYGDSMPTKRVELPLVAPVTAVFLVLGVGFALTHLAVPIVALTLIAFVVTLGGALIATGNLDVGRAGGVVPYLYALAGYGAAGLLALAARSPRPTRRGLAAALVVACLLATGLNTRALVDHWTDLDVQRAQRSNLALLSTWLGSNVREGERAIVLAPSEFNVLDPNDAAWLRQREMPGIGALDVDTVLRDWATATQPAVLVVFCGESTRDVAAYFEWLAPELRFAYVPDPLHAGGELAFARAVHPPADLAARLDALACHGAQVEYEVATAAAPLRRTGVVPVIDGSTWPAGVRGAIYHAQPPARSVRVRYRAQIELADAGDYQFVLQSYPGDASLSVDEEPSAAAPVHLDAGPHVLRVDAVLRPEANAAAVRLTWNRAGDPAGRTLVPFYRLTPADPACRARRAPRQ